MKTKLFTLIFLLVTSLISAQKVEELKTETAKFYEAYYNMDFDKIVYYYHPNYVLQTDKETIVKNLDILFQNDHIGVRYVFPTMTFNFEPIKKIDEADYCVIKFKNSKRIINSSKREKQQIKMDLEAYKSSPDIKSVKFEENRNSYFIEQYETWIAINSPETKGKWKFVELKTKFRFENELIAPVILKELGL